MHCRSPGPAPYEIVGPHGGSPVAGSGRSINIMVHLDADGSPIAPPAPQHSFGVAAGPLLPQGSGGSSFTRVRASCMLLESSVLLLLSRASLTSACKSISGCERLRPQCCTLMPCWDALEPVLG
jgi:hypothetical protein